ncbi:hypothetical protein [Streptomyces sp. DH24]|uniref:hypothetical protein n=1 Tax=Streptomyces sp. DH24 TaxID=3040123 RepID=UPI0024424FF6|nr:hypothetical protein [Streptomyces sp. DH24]MDG9716975.1 hypothetical protein [Streptomyces sp. DH24]
MSTLQHPEQPDERPGEPSGQPSGEPALTDEQLAAFLREAAEGGGAGAPKEPSARARMVTRRLREEEEAAARQGGRGGRGRRLGRGRRAEAPAAAPPGWRTGPAWQETDARRTRRRRVLAGVGVTLAVALALVAVRPSLVLDRIPGLGTDAAASPTPLPAETGRPDDAPGDAASSGAATLEHPFRGSPAERWADGADAIELPEAKALAGLSEADVARGLRRAKEFLVAANLDEEVLRGGTPRRALDLLDPKQPGLLSDVRRSLREPTRDNDPVMLFSRFDPDEARLAGDVVKVRGHMTVAEGRPGEVEVHADYTFVYPTVRAHGDSDAVERTIVRRDITLLLSNPRYWEVTEGRLMLDAYDVRSYNDACGVYDGYFHPDFPQAPSPGTPATGPTVDPYDRRDGTGGAGGSDECATVSRT